MKRIFIFHFCLLLCEGGTGFAQGLDTVKSSHAPHRISPEQLTEIRRKEGLAQDQPISPTPFSMPSSSRGMSIDSSEMLGRLFSKMSRRDRRFHFGHAKATLEGRDLEQAISRTKDVVLYELEVTETEPDLPLIDVDGDGVQDQVDAIRYSGPGFPNRRLCGPTIVINRHQKLIINLKNKLKASREPVLEWNAGAEPPGPQERPAYWMMDAPHNLFSTNLHTHGLHVSPGGGHDNAFLDLPPAEGDTPNELFLDYELPQNHVAGTFWYHAHEHGSAAYQLANGLAGALIVLGDTDPATNDLEKLQEIQAANRIKNPTDNAKDVEYGRVFLLQQLVFTKVGGQDGGQSIRWIVDPADVNDRKSAPAEKNVGRITEGIPSNKPESAEVLAVNGQNAPTIEIQRGQIERWRLIHAGRESALNLAWYRAGDLKDASIDVPGITNAIETYEIATDGIPTGHLKKKIHNELYPGYRSDVLVRVTDQATDGEYWLLPSEAKRLVRTHLGPVKNATPVAKLVVQGQLATAMSLPPVAQIMKLRRPAPDVTGAETLELNFTFADKERFGISTVPRHVGKPYAESGTAESITIKIDTPQIWNLGVKEFLPGVAESVKHPFHMHVNPFYVPSLGVWKDTLVISRELVTPIHFVPSDYCGRSVVHCHILDHEDQGMMKDLNIVGTSRVQYPDLYLLERVAEAEQTKIDALEQEPGKNNVLVFISGMGCPHCADGLVRLWKRSDPLKDFDAMIKCMSATPFQRRELTALGVKKKDHFTFHEVPDGFDLTRCDSSSTTANETVITHGVLIFDKHQKLRYRYLADRPLSDLDEITYALMELNEPSHAPSPKGRFRRVPIAKRNTTSMK
jgi:FtsP/CotA-like multicopper oxidase with cupredoxin domain